MNEQFIKKRVEEYKRNRSLYAEYSAKILDVIKTILQADSPELKVASFSSRAKEVESLEKKLAKDKYTEDSEITDLAGARIILYSRRDIEPVKKVIEQNFEIDQDNSPDKSKDLGTDKVGYRGVHYVITLDKKRSEMGEYKKYKGLKCEIQITSLIAHTWSEITHEKGYKFEGVLPQDLDRRKNLLAGMLELADMEMDSYVEAYDSYVGMLEQEIEKGSLKSTINTSSLQRYMMWKFPFISPQIFRDVELIIQELEKFGVQYIEELNSMVKPEFAEEIKKSSWRSLDGIIRNILIIHDAKKYFKDVWNPSMNEMNIKNYKLYELFHVDIDSICKERDIHVVGK